MVLVSQLGFDSSNVTFLSEMMYGMVLYGGGGSPFWIALVVARDD
jgi:hypothetical protein